MALRVIATAQMHKRSISLVSTLFKGHSVVSSAAACFRGHSGSSNLSIRAVSTASASATAPAEVRAITNFNSVTELQQKACAAFADRDIFGVRNGSKFDWMTYKDFHVQVQRFRNVLANHYGITKGDKVSDHLQAPLRRLNTH
jgi:hypothetical protein